MASKGRSFLKAALLVAASAGLSGCVYDVGLGLASDGYYDDAYGCDPYGGYDAYYNCDYGQAFSTIGFGGGWYDNYYYPGHGIFLFDTFGRRYPMREQYRRYWGERRHSWYREHRGRDGDGGRYQERQRGDSDYAPSGAYGWRDRQDGQPGTGSDERRKDQHGSRRGSRRGQAEALGSKSAGAVAPRPARVQQGLAVEPLIATRVASQPRPEPANPPPRRVRDEGDNIREQ